MIENISIRRIANSKMALGRVITWQPLRPTRLCKLISSAFQVASTEETAALTCVILRALVFTATLSMQPPDICPIQPANKDDLDKLKLLFTCMVAFCFVSAASARSPKQDALGPSTQILVVTTSDWNGVEGVLQRYERSQTKKKWKAVGAQIQAVVGKNGLGWGVGLPPTNDAAIRGVQDPVKKEGDGKAPAGIFHLSTAFGYAAQQPAGWRMPYLNLTQSVECVDDTASKSYNRVVNNTKVSPDWNSSEHMLRSDELYRSGFVVDHNSDPVTPGSGSCIFMHIWRGSGGGTAGCTAMPEEQIEAVLAWLDPAKRPLLVQLPLPQYAQLRKRWKLPALSPINRR